MIYCKINDNLFIGFYNQPIYNGLIPIQEFDDLEIWMLLNIPIYYKDNSLYIDETEENLAKITEYKAQQLHEQEKSKAIENLPETIEETEEALCELGDLSDDSANTNEDLMDAVAELGDLVAAQADTIAQLQEIIEQLTKAE